MTTHEDAQLDELQQSLRDAQTALEHTRDQGADKRMRSRLLRQVDMLSHLVLMHTGVHGSESLSS